MSLVAIYQSLPLLHRPESYSALAINGLRSSMTAVFEAIALRNPYPAQYFDEPAWNQMVLKALFENSQVSLIEGLNRRANPGLSQMLMDYADERKAAHRPVDLALWQLVDAGRGGPLKMARALTALENLQPAKKER